MFLFYVFEWGIHLMCMQFFLATTMPRGTPVLHACTNGILSLQSTEVCKYEYAKLHVFKNPKIFNQTNHF